MKRSPERFENLILCDTRSEADDNKAKIARSNNIKKVITDGSVAFVEAFIPTCVHAPNIERRWEMIMLHCSDSGHRIQLPASADVCSRIISRTDTTHVLSEIKIPTLLICGEHDAITPLDGMKKMASLIPGSEVVPVPEAGHISPLENPEYVNTKNYFPFLKV